MKILSPFVNPARRETGESGGLSGFDHLRTSCMIVGFEKGPYKKSHDPQTH